jgi:Mce-associated membrane protein
MPEGDTVTADDALGTAEEPARSPAPPSSSLLGPRRLVVVLVVALLVAGLVVTQLQLSSQHALNNERTTALAAARTGASDVATYSYAHLHRDFAKVEGESTPAFRRSFVQSSGGLTKVLSQYKATATAKVLAAGISSITSTKAVAILFVNQTVKNTAQKGGPTTDDSRIEITLVRSGGRWLIDRLKLL